MELIFSTIALCASAFCILVELSIIQIKKPKEDKYENFRNEKGLLGRKKE
jgi:hypothetical protein